MKKFFLTLLVATYATAIFSQTSWIFKKNDVALAPVTANLGIGGIPQTNAKLTVIQDLTITTGSSYGIYSAMSGKAPNQYSGFFTGGNFVVMNGWVGIGTSTPQYLLDVSGTMKGTAGLFNNVGIGTTNPQYPLDVSGTMKGTTGLFNKIGIGTTNPQEPLEVNGNVKFTGELVVSGTSSNAKAISMVNPSKTGAGQAAIWRFYNMGGSQYGNSFQIWNYGVDGSAGCGNGGLCANRFTITDNGNVGIGTMFPNVKLDVIGVIRATEVKVCLNQGCDFVFDKDYKLMPLNDLSSFITENKHLPEIAPAAVMESEGINLSEMNAKLLQKVEELTLYLIQQNGQIENLQQQIDELKK